MRRIDQGYSYKKSKQISGAEQLVEQVKIQYPVPHNDNEISM